jgi:hypothetical protein
MRFGIVLLLIGAIGAFGCGSDEEGSGGAGGTAGTGGTGGAGGTGGMDGNEPPQITMVAWAPAGSCSPGVQSDYTVTVTATDPDSPAGDLMYDGSVSGCSGQVDAATSTVRCPNAASYGGSVVVEDGDGNVSIPVSFTIDVCEAGSVSP